MQEIEIQKKEKKRIKERKVIRIEKAPKEGKQ